MDLAAPDGRIGGGRRGAAIAADGDTRHLPDGAAHAHRVRAGLADELIDEVARSEVNGMGDAMATAGGGGEASEPEVKKKKKSKWTVKQKSHGQKRGERRARADGDGG